MLITFDLQTKKAPRSSLFYQQYVHHNLVCLFPEHLSYIEGYENDPDYMVGMDKKVEDYDKFYDDYEYPSAADSSTSGTSRRDIAVWTLLLAFVMAAKTEFS